MNIALIGYGKMGKAIEEIALAKGHTVCLKISSSNAADLTLENLQKCDVAIEFTGPESAAKNITACMEAGVPVISGSTGWLKDLNKIEALSLQTNGAFLYASNFSVGVNIFFELNNKLAALMKGHDYDVSIKEIHHTAKKDAPSGTAITLAEQIIAHSDKMRSWTQYNSGGKGELKIISERTDPAPGTHHIKYTSAIDDIEITHTAHNRRGFAEGAVLAAEFLSGKKGIFTMKDVLGL